jgi:hypothetical protein
VKQRVRKPVHPLTVMDSLQSLKDHFNAHRGKPRFLAVISPTCRYCIEGANAIQASLIKGFPGADMSMSIVWIDGVKTDNVEKAKRRAKTMNDARLQHFHDPNRLAGKAIAKMLGGEGKIAWDIYLFFDKNSRWMNQPPIPLSYMHQLLPEYVTWADPEHYRCGDQLRNELHKTMKRMTGATDYLSSR